MVDALPGVGGVGVDYEEIHRQTDVAYIEAVLEDHPEVRVLWDRPEVLEVGV